MIVATEYDHAAMFDTGSMQAFFPENKIDTTQSMAFCYC